MILFVHLPLTLLTFQCSRALHKATLSIKAKALSTFTLFRISSTNTMELTKDKSRSSASQNEARLRPSPFHADQERRDLQSALTAPQEVVATAVPISGDSFEQNSLPIATATAVASVPCSTGSSAAPSAPSRKLDKTNDEVAVAPLPDNTTVPTFRHYANPAAIQRENESLLRRATHRGRAESEIDNTKDFFAKAHLENMRRETAQALKAADVKARKAKQWDEGLTVDEAVHRNYARRESDTTRRSEEEEVRPFGTTTVDGKRGYEVAKYDVADYETEEYNVSEYKSVYD